MSITQTGAGQDLVDTLVAAGVVQGLSLVFTIILYPAFGALGGVIGQSIFKKS